MWFRWSLLEIYQLGRIYSRSTDVVTDTGHISIIDIERRNTSLISISPISSSKSADQGRRNPNLPVISVSGVDRRV
ncbi:hypothetical protein ACHWQZ_G006443 [Mnemiopsis leidyi]